jgi:hypothetical protein
LITIWGAFVASSSSHFLEYFASKLGNLKEQRLQETSSFFLREKKECQNKSCDRPSINETRMNLQR